MILCDPRAVRGDSPIYLARHEFFHVIQKHYFDGSFWVSIHGAQQLSSLWWNEATAEWAAGRALALDPMLVDQADTDGSAYASHIDYFLGSPNVELGRHDGGHEYGAFVVAEYLAQRFPLTGDFLTSPSLGPSLIPDDELIKQTWALAAEGTGALEALETLSVGQSTPISTFLNQFAKASYLLDEQGSPSLGGTYRDQDPQDPETPKWRKHLLDSAANPQTKGDSAGPDFLNSQPRAARQRSGTILAAPLSSKLVEDLEPGGSAYFEYKIPSDHTNVYRLDVDVAAFGVADPAAMALSFGSYPARCAADRVLIFGQPTADPFGYLHYHAHVEIPLPEDCGMITVVVTHGAPRTGSTATATVQASMLAPFDSFERSSGPLDWGVPSSSSLPWADPAGGPVKGATVPGSLSFPGRSARLDDGGSAMHGDPSRPIQDAVMIGRLEACTDPKATFSIETQFAAGRGAAVNLAADGTLVVRTEWGSTTTTVFGLAPCSPWYLTLGMEGSGVAVKVWQVTAAEPVDATLVYPTSSDLGGRLVLSATGSAVILDVLDVEWQQTG